jgi:hypothetical protein
MAWKLIKIFNVGTSMVWNFEKDPTHVGTKLVLIFLKNRVKDETKAQGKEYVDLAKLITWAMIKIYIYFIDGQDMKQYQVLIFRCIA